MEAGGDLEAGETTEAGAEVRTKCLGSGVRGEGGEPQQGREEATGLGYRLHSVRPQVSSQYSELALGPLPPAIQLL